MKKYKANNRDYTKLPFHIVGESYAGHYVPHLSAKVVKESAKAGEGDFKINFAGAAIGNGLTDPLVQFKYYGDYLEMYNKFGPGGQIVKPAVYGLMKTLDPVCTALVGACNGNSSNTTKYLECVNAYVVCAYSQLMPIQLSGINPYDIREKCNPALPLCYNFTLITAYLNQPSVMEALGTTGHKWSTCNRLVDMTMVYAGDWMLDFQQDIEYILDSNYRVTLYAGEYDFICNWLGNHEWATSFKWNGHQDFLTAPNVTWNGPKSVASSGTTGSGIAKAAKGLTFVKVFNAGTFQLPYQFIE